MDKNILPNKEERRYLPCLLRRMTDFEPEIKKEVLYGGITLKQLKKDIFENIEMLLNSRSHTRTQDLFDFSDIQDSVLAFGLSDFCGRSCSLEDKEDIRNHLLQQLRWFEPRISADSLEVVFINSSDLSNSAIEFQISGYIQAGELSQEIVFISQLDLETGGVALKKPTD